MQWLLGWSPDMQWPPGMAPDMQWPPGRAPDMQWPTLRPKFLVFNAQPRLQAVYLHLNVDWVDL